MLALPAGGGLWLDRKYGTMPWFTILGVLMGGYLAFRGLQQLIRDLEK
jgi:F0F1-type ATP synthase assembly protein I